MKTGSTLFLKIVITLIGLGVLTLCIVLAVEVAPDVGGYAPILYGLSVPAIPFFVALYQTIKLLVYVDKNIAFSELSVTALKNIKYCALIISGLFLLGMPYIFRVADMDDAPGVVLLGLVIISTSIVIAVFAAVLQKLVRNAIDIKTENDLTV